MYPRHEWEEIAACCDTTICLGVNDLTSAKFVSDKCGMTTIRVTNNQQPQTPLFSPVANLSRPYSQTRSNTQRALMQPDEVLRLDNAKSIVMHGVPAGHRSTNRRSNDKTNRTAEFYALRYNFYRRIYNEIQIFFIRAGRKRFKASR